MYNKLNCIVTKSFNRLSKLLRNRKEALNSPKAKQQELVIDKEYNLLVENNTFDRILRYLVLKDRKILGTRQVNNRKLGSNSEVKKHKSRFVVKGYTQIYRLDFDETYALVVKALSYRLIFVL